LLLAFIKNKFLSGKKPDKEMPALKRIFPQGITKIAIVSKA
jgi:hypothetical protein